MKAYPKKKASYGQNAKSPVHNAGFCLHDFKSLLLKNTTSNLKMLFKIAICRRSHDSALVHKVL